MIEVIKTWESVRFQSVCKETNTVVYVDLEYNHETNAIHITSPHEEGVSFKRDNIEEAYVRGQCVLAAVTYLKNLKKDGKEKKKKRRN